MEDINIKSVRYPVEVDEKLEKLALKFGRTKRRLFIQMVAYFYGNKKDPADLNDEVLKKEISAGITRIISFIRKQESDFILPIFTNAEKLLKVAGVHSKYLDGLGQYATKDQEQTNFIISRLALLDKAIAKTQAHLDEKAVLKNRFKQILEYYINQRETLGWPTSNTKKEELQKQVRQSLNNL